MSEFRPKWLLPFPAAVPLLALVVIFLGGGTAIPAAGPQAAGSQAFVAAGAFGVTPPPKTVNSPITPLRDAVYIWSASRNGSSLRLRGSVPSEEDRRTVLGMVKAHFPDLEVDDRLKVAEGAPAKEQWLGAVSFGLKQLTHLKSGSVRLLNVSLRLDGEARSAADYEEVKKTMVGPLPTGLSITGDYVRPPMADPYIFSAELSPDALILAGSVPNEKLRDQLRDMARQLFERPTLDDRLEFASGSPKDWENAVRAALRALSRLNSGKVALSGLALTIEGQAPDKGTAVAVSYQLKRDLPSLFSSSENISWKEATNLSGSAVVQRTGEPPALDSPAQTEPTSSIPSSSPQR